MTLTAVLPPFPLFTDRTGAPLDAGFVYIGVANQNPVSQPIAVYWDSALTIPAAQPIRTINGYASNNGTPGLLFSASDYSITVKDKNNVQVLTSPSGARAGLGSIVLAATETLTAQAGAEIILEDGSELSIGDATGTGVLVNVASNARFVGALVPNVDNEDLGTDSRRWDMFAGTIDAEDVDGALVYSADNPSVPTTDKQVASLSQLSAVVASGKVSAGAGAYPRTATISTRHRNIASATWTAAGVCEVTLDRAVSTDSVPMACPQANADTGAQSEMVSTTVVQVTTWAAGAPGTAAFNLVVVGSPETLIP